MSVIDETKGEKEIVEGMGMKYVNMPFPSFKNPPEEYLNKFFEVMQKARTDKEKVYIHCREGKDRTGLFAAMYKAKYNLADLPTTVSRKGVPIHIYQSLATFLNYSVHTHSL